MRLTAKLSERLKSHPKRIVFPEGTDPRILQAARQFATRELGVPILLGDRSEIKRNAAALDIKLDGIRVLEPSRSEELDLFREKFMGLRRFKGLNHMEVDGYLANVNYFATLMLATSQAEAIVSGATVAASSALRPLLTIIPMQQGVSTVSSLQVLDLGERRIGANGVLFLADCGVIPDPTSDQLGDIAVTTAAIMYHLTNEMPKVAMLSYSSKSTNKRHPSVEKMKAATSVARDLARTLQIPMDIDGELQVDAALDIATARAKGIDSSVAGSANVLIFPDLNSGNIASKMVQILAQGRLYGQVLTGLSRPAAEISRGASAHDIFGTAVLVGAQAIDRKLLYPMNEGPSSPGESGT